MKLTYICKKTGQVVSDEFEKLPAVAQHYLAQKGYGEYMDNYHAGVTVKEHGAAKCKEMVTPMVVEATTRLRAGDVPGNKANVIAELADENTRLKAELEKLKAAAKKAA